MADVFISYHRSEGTSALVRRIADELESMDISCWYDTKDPDPGYFVQTIEQEILRCKVFLLIWDEGANNSEWCLTETYTAFEGENHAVRIPFQIGSFKKDNDMKFYMKRCQIFPGGDSPENANIQKLIDKVTDICKGNHVQNSNSEAQPKNSQPSVEIPTIPQKTKQETPKVQLNSVVPQLVNIIQHGFCGSSVMYALDSNGLLRILGAGYMHDYGYKDNPLEDIKLWLILSTSFKPDLTIDTPWWNQRERISDVYIENGVTSIGKHAFSHCRNLKNVTIPDSVKIISQSAFSWCHCLKCIIVPANAYIADDAFPETTTVIRRE